MRGTAPHSNSREEKLEFDFRVLVKHRHRSLFSSDFLDHVVHTTGCFDILFDEQISTKDLPGFVLCIKSKQI